MKAPTFAEGTGVAAALAVFAAILVAALPNAMTAAATIGWTATIVPLCYIVYLLKRAQATTGRLTVIALWVTATAALAWTGQALEVRLLSQAGAIWLVRTLYFHDRFLTAAMDLLLTLLAAGALAWSVSQTGSIAAGVWTFFLVQALFVAIPDIALRTPNGTQAIYNERFERSRRHADRALEQLIESRRGGKS